jgi:hypothetical protein
LSLSSSEPTRLLLLTLPSISGGLSFGVPEAGFTGMSGPSESGCSQRVLPGYNTITRSSATVSQRHQLVVLRHYTPLLTQSPAFRATAAPAPQLGGMIVRRAASPVICHAVKQIEYPPPIFVFLSFFSPCTRHRLVLPPFISLDTFCATHCTLHSFRLRIARPNTIFHPNTST